MIVEHDVQAPAVLLVSLALVMRVVRKRLAAQPGGGGGGAGSGSLEGGDAQTDADDDH